MAMKCLDAMACPLCGGDPLEQQIDPHAHVFVNMPDHPGSYTIECPPCDLLLIKPTKTKALTAWNRRAG